VGGGRNSFEANDDTFLFDILIRYHLSNILSLKCHDVLVCVVGSMHLLPIAPGLELSLPAAGLHSPVDYLNLLQSGTQLRRLVLSSILDFHPLQFVFTRIPASATSILVH
jgi:hypothetical protein